MSTSKTFNVKLGKNYQINATARGYYDLQQVKRISADPINLSMKAYDGLIYNVDLSKNSVRPGEINFDNTVLPYVENNALTKTNYCFGNSGTIYDLPAYEEVYSNITKVGNVNISKGIASNFNSSSYATIDNTLNLGTDDYEIVIGFEVTQTNTDYQVLLNSNPVVYLVIAVSPELLLHSNVGAGSNWTGGLNGNTTIELNKKYLAKVKRVSGVRYMYLSSDNGNTWSEENSIEDTTSCNKTFRLGQNSGGTQIFTGGKLYLEESYIKNASISYNLGEYDLSPKLNPNTYTLVGNASINGSICSGFDSSSKVILNNVRFNTTEDIDIKFITGDNVSTIQSIIDCEKLGLYVENGTFNYYNQDINSFVNWKSVSTSTAYKIKVKIKSSNEYSLGFALESDDQYEYIDVIINKFNLNDETCYIGNGIGLWDRAFQGTIDISGIPGLTQLTELKPGIFQDYEDNGQANKLNCFSNNNQYTVLSPNENIIYYMKHQYKDWIQPILSSDGTMGGDLFAVNSSSILRAGREAYKAFDGDTSTIDDNWHSSQGHPSWIEWYNPNPLKITRIKIQNRNSADGGSFVNTYKLSYSDDYSNWVDLLSGTSPSQENFTYWNIDITEENPHKYWRLTCLTSSGSNSDYTSIQTISITAQEYVSLKGTPDDYDEIVKYTYLGTVDIPKHNIYNVDNFYGWSNDSKSIFTKTLQLSTDIPLYNSSYKQESAITISSFADNSITLSNNEVYTRNNTLDKHVVLSTSASGGEVNPPNPDIPTTLKFGDRIDNKATVVGTFESSDLGTVAFAVLDAQYRNPSVEWVQSSIVNSLTDMPLYTINEALAAKESATHNTDYVISVGGEGAFSYCRSIDPLNYNGKTYNCQLPNAYELNEIYNNRESLDTFDTTVSANETKKLSSWGFGNVYPEVLSSSRDKQFGYGFHLNHGNQVIWRGNPGRLGVCPIIEIPLSE